MAIKVQKGNELAAPPAGAALKYVVTDTATGKYYSTNAGTGGGGSTEPFEVDGDFTIQVTRHQVLDYICFIGLPNATDIKIGTTENGNEIKDITVADDQPVVLHTYMEADKTIYVTGVPAGTLIKTKFS